MKQHFAKLLLILMLCLIMSLSVSAAVPLSSRDHHQYGLSTCAAKNIKAICDQTDGCIWVTHNQKLSNARANGQGDELWLESASCLPNVFFDAARDQNNEDVVVGQRWSYATLFPSPSLNRIENKNPVYITCPETVVKGTALRCEMRVNSRSLPFDPQYSFLYFVETTPHQQNQDFSTLISTNLVFDSQVISAGTSQSVIKQTNDHQVLYPWNTHLFAVSVDVPANTQSSEVRVDVKGSIVWSMQLGSSVNAKDVNPIHTFSKIVRIVNPSVQQQEIPPFDFDLRCPDTASTGSDVTCEIWGQGEQLYGMSAIIRSDQGITASANFLTYFLPSIGTVRPVGSDPAAAFTARLNQPFGIGWGGNYRSVFKLHDNARQKQKVAEVSLTMPAGVGSKQVALTLTPYASPIVYGANNQVQSAPREGTPVTKTETIRLFVPAQNSPDLVVSAGGVENGQVDASVIMQDSVENPRQGCINFNDVVAASHAVASNPAATAQQIQEVILSLLTHFRVDCSGT
ncbi:hypothetical protein HYV86_00430 [Candidatus Woesearchaeota archaeon]|nr:hypothetical protein [Candidatus Woesearchaeota archaeon]